MAYSNARPAGFSDSDPDEDYEGDYDCGGGGGGPVEVKPSLDWVDTTTDTKMEEVNSYPVQNAAAASLSISNGSTSTNTMIGPLEVEGSLPLRGCGRGAFARGRGRGDRFQQQDTPQTPSSIPPVRQSSEEDGPQRNWCNGGKGRGGGGDGAAHVPNVHGHRPRRRSGSNSPNSGGGVPTDKRKLKEDLLKKIPDFGVVSSQQETFAKEMCKHLKWAWEGDRVFEDEPKFSRKVKKVFFSCHTNICKNVPNLALFLVINSIDYLAHQGGKNQSLAILQGFTDYIKSVKPKPDDPLFLFSFPLQQLAFTAAVFQRKESLLKAILITFELTKHDQNHELKTFLLQEIRKLVDQKEYTEACYCASYLKLHSYFDIHMFLVPLVLQDKPSVVEVFLEKSVRHQQELIMYLDQLFKYGNNSVFGQLITYRTEYRVPDTKEDKFHYKPITKLIKRLRTKYRLGFEYCPRIGHRQRFGELRHLFSRRYEKNEMSAESFQELIDQLAAEESLREDIIKYYMEYQDYKNAADFIIKYEMFLFPSCQHPEVLEHLPEYWKDQWEAKNGGNQVDECWDDDDGGTSAAAVVVKVPQEDIPLTTTTAPVLGMEERYEENMCFHFNGNAQEPELACDEMEVETTPTKVKLYYMFPLQRNDLVIVDDPNQLLEFCSALGQARVSKTPPLISGFDSEWKPILSKSSGAALLQIAFEDKVYLIDIVTLKKKHQGQGPCIWKALRQEYFENEKVLKLGFDVRNDVKMLTETVPEWMGLNLSWRGMLDLSSLKSLILKECPHLFVKDDGTSRNTEGESGLSELVYLCTGRSLSKDEQMSDWENRPMRESQVLYAASDAYCLISVYRKLNKLCQKKKVDLERIVTNYFKGLANGSGGNGGDGGSSSKKKKGSVELVLDLLRVPGGGEGEVGGKEDIGGVKLVVDTMLLGLGRYLRSLGFDTVLLGNQEGHEVCVEYVRNEGRRIVTRGLQAYGRIARQLDVDEEDMIYLVKSETTAAQLEEICNHFNVALEPSKLFTICFRCNTSVFIKISSKLIFNLMETAGCHLIKRIEGKSDQELLQDSLNHFKNKSFDDMILYFEKEDEKTKKWTLLEETSLKVMEEGRYVLTPRGEKVELTRLQMISHIVDKDRIYVCNGCGKCYWSSRVLEEYYKKNMTQ